jgi:hypothetical protein
MKQKRLKIVLAAALLLFAGLAWRANAGVNNLSSIALDGGNTHDWWFKPSVSGLSRDGTTNTPPVTITNYADIITYSAELAPVVYTAAVEVVVGDAPEPIRFYSVNGFFDVDPVSGICRSVASGEDEILLKSATLERRLPLKAETTLPGQLGYQEDLDAHGYVTNSVKEHVNTNFLALIDGHSGADTNLAIFSVEDDSATNYVRNADGWAAPLDLTCVSAWNSTSGKKRKMTMITPRHGLAAAHHHIRQGWTGSDRRWLVRFVDATNGVHERTVSDYEYVLPKENLNQLIPSYIDVVVLRLDSELPASIRPAARLPNDYLDFIPYTRGFTNERNDQRYHENYPVVMPDQQDRATLGESISLGLAGCPGYYEEYGGYRPEWFVPVTGKLRLFQRRETFAPFYRPKIDGDSGSPLLMYLENDQPLLLGTMTYGFGGGAEMPLAREVDDWMRDMVPYEITGFSYADEVQRVITEEFGDTNVWQSADLSGYAAFERVD